MQQAGAYPVIAHAEKYALNSLCGISLNATLHCLGRVHSLPLHSLNSLCGISLNATLKTAAGWSNALNTISLNSLCGISLNATIKTMLGMTLGHHLGIGSQFPLWDFVECNANQGYDIYANVTTSGSTSQFPLWDFVECNLGHMLSRHMSLAVFLSIPFVGFR